MPHDCDPGWVERQGDAGAVGTGCPTSSLAVLIAPARLA